MGSSATAPSRSRAARTMSQYRLRLCHVTSISSPPSQSGVQLNQISPNINQPCPNPERTSSADLNVDANVSLPPGSPKLRKRDRQAG